MSLVELKRCDMPLAEIFRGRLAASGIPAFCFDEGASAAFGEGLQVRVMVDENDLADARALLAEPVDQGDIDKTDGA